MILLAGWLLHSIRLAAALGLAVLAMQAPAVTREYQAALLQLVRSSDQEIAERRTPPTVFTALRRLRMRAVFSPNCARSSRRMRKPSPPRSTESAACVRRMTGSKAARICCAR
jgi:hypothetical protein